MFGSQGPFDPRDADLFCTYYLSNQPPGANPFVTCEFVVKTVRSIGIAKRESYTNPDQLGRLDFRPRSAGRVPLNVIIRLYRHN